MPIDYAKADNYFIVQLYGEDSHIKTLDLAEKAYKAYQKASPSRTLSMITSMIGRTPSIPWDGIEKLSKLHIDLYPMIHAIYVPGNAYLFENAKLYVSHVNVKCPGVRWNVFDNLADLFRWLKKVEEKMKKDKENSP